MKEPPIPLVDLKAGLPAIMDEVDRAFREVISSTAFILGPQVAAFEKAFADFCGVRECIGVGNGTDALELALRAIDVGPGDEVVLPANTFVATALAVARIGAKPVLVDCDLEYLLMDPVKAESAVTGRTKVLLPVHLYGQCAPMESLQSLAERRGLHLVEDAAQAQGARHNGTAAGSFGVAAATSFYPGKNLGAFGDAGAVLTSSEGVTKKVRALRNYGSDVKYRHPERGFNSRLDTLQAVVLDAKLRRLDEANAARRAAAARYHDLLHGHEWIRLPGTLQGNEHIWHLYVVRVPNRDAVLARLQQAGIGAAIHYPVPIHLQGAFADLGHGPGDFPVTEAAAGEILSLPMFPEITPEQQARVARALLTAAE